MLVFCGGLVGTLLRWLLGLLVPAGTGAAPGTLGLGLSGAGATLAVNLVGSFLLGALLGWAGAAHRSARLLLGTGVLGSCTTYSAFALLLVDGVGPAYAALSLLGGVALAALGLWIGARRGDGRPQLGDQGAGPTPADARGGERGSGSNGVGAP